MRPHLSTGTLMMPKHSFRAPWARILSATLAVSLLTVAACSSDSGGGAGGSKIVVVEIVTIPNSQATTALIPGNTRQLLGVPTNGSENWVDKPVVWESSNTAVVSVSATGLATAVAGGSAYIRATAGGKTDSLLFAVRFPVGTVTLAPAVVTLTREASQQLTATLLDTQGATVTGRTIAWSSSDVTVATVSSSGLVAATVATADGTTTTITASVANASDGGIAVVGTRLVTVTGNAVVQTVGVTGGIDGTHFRGSTGTQQLTGTSLSGLGNVQPAVLTWTTSAPAIATVDAAGLVTFAGDTGVVTITATATGFGAGGSSPSGTSIFWVAKTMVAGVATPITLASDQYVSYAVNSAGLDSIVVDVPGTGTGDLDWGIVRPTVSWTLKISSGSGFACFGNTTSGNAGSCSVTKAAILPGWYAVHFYAWTGGGFTDPVGGETATLTVYP